jgi:hypothetical protein
MAAERCDWMTAVLVLQLWRLCDSGGGVVVMVFVWHWIAKFRNFCIRPFFGIIWLAVVAKRNLQQI